MSKLHHILILPILVLSYFLSVLYACDACTDTAPEKELINGGNSTAPAEETIIPKFVGKSFQVLICSANVHGFKEATPEAILRAIDQLKSDNDDIVIIGLQECYQDPKKFKLPPGYNVYAEGGIDNSIFVYQKKDFDIKQQVYNLPNFNTLRYVNLITLSAANELAIANTHLLGGRYDDKLWFQFPDGRAQQLAEILKHKPDFILGDFNADVKDDLPKDYWKDELLLLCTDTDSEEKLKRYKISGHQYLADQDYKSALDRDAIWPTTPFNTVVDWIFYLNKNRSTKIKKITILGSGKIEAIPKTLSDHNFPWVRFQIELS